MLYLFLSYPTVNSGTIRVYHKVFRLSGKLANLDGGFAPRVVDCGSCLSSRPLKEVFDKRSVLRGGLVVLTGSVDRGVC